MENPETSSAEQSGGSLERMVGITISEHNLARLKWCVELCDHIEPGNCAHIAANIRGSLRYVIKEAGEPNMKVRDAAQENL